MTAPVAIVLSPIQKRILAFIRGYAAANGYAPSLREIADGTGRAFSTVDYQVRRLETLGWIRRHPNRPRALVLLDPEGAQ